MSLAVCGDHRLHSNKTYASLQSFPVSWSKKTSSWSGKKENGEGFFYYTTLLPIFRGHELKDQRDRVDEKKGLLEKKSATLNLMFIFHYPCAFYNIQKFLKKFKYHSVKCILSTAKVIRNTDLKTCSYIKFKLIFPQNILFPVGRDIWRTLVVIWLELLWKSTPRKRQLIQGAWPIYILLRPIR